MTPLRFVIGYDPVEATAYHVLTHSILTRASVPVSFLPLARPTLTKTFTRPRGPMESTDFSISRFLTPYLAGYEGIAVYLDSDMLCRTDVAGLWDEVDRISAAGPWAVAVCPHDYTPTGTTKFLKQPQSVYPRKNWSSLMVFQADRCRALTPEYVNVASGLDLHRFCWISDDQIATLPLEWNWLVGEYDDTPAAKILHFTLGGPWFDETTDCDGAADWFAEYAAMVG
jgi:hypothetical protein